MHTSLPYFIAAGVGLVVAYLATEASELRSMRLPQLVLVPVLMALCCTGGVFCVLGIVFLAFLLAPNIAHYLGVGMSNFLDSYDWTPIEEEIALRPIRLLIDKENHREALTRLDELLTKHKPTFEAVLLKAKLLHHIGRVDETVATLPALIALSNSTAQQLAVMELLDFLEQNHPDPPKPPVPGNLRIEIHHELVVFQMSSDTPPLHKAIPPGAYQVEETNHRNRRWLKLAGEDWGNAEMWWEAVLASKRPAEVPPKKGLLWRIARMQQAVTFAIKSKPHGLRMAEAQAFFKEANQLIRRDEWQKAVPLLQKASACDPDRYEYAYRWVQAVRQTANADVTARVVSQVLQQSQWTKDERDMLGSLFKN